MSYTVDDWRKAITKLLTLTSGEKIKWEIRELYTGDAWTTVDESFSTELNGKFYVISKIRRRRYVDEDEYYWDQGYNFSVFEKSDTGQAHKIANAPEISSLGALFEAAETNLAFNKNALGGLLS